MTFVFETKRESDLRFPFFAGLCSASICSPSIESDKLMVEKRRKFPYK